MGGGGGRAAYNLMLVAVHHLRLDSSMRLRLPSRMSGAVRSHERYHVVRASRCLKLLTRSLPASMPLTLPSTMGFETRSVIARIAATHLSRRSRASLGRMVRRPRLVGLWMAASSPSVSRRSLAAICMAAKSIEYDAVTPMPASTREARREEMAPEMSSSTAHLMPSR